LTSDIGVVIGLMLASRLPGKNECDLTWTCQGIWLAALDSQSKFQRLCWL